MNFRNLWTNNIVFWEFLGLSVSDAAARRGAPRRTGCFVWVWFSKKKKNICHVFYENRNHRNAAGRRGAPRRAGEIIFFHAQRVHDTVLGENSAGAAARRGAPRRPV